MPGILTQGSISMTRELGGYPFRVAWQLFQGKQEPSGTKDHQTALTHTRTQQKGSDSFFFRAKVKQRGGMLQVSQMLQVNEIRQTNHLSELLMPLYDTKASRTGIISSQSIPVK